MTVQVKLQPLAEQADALERTLGAANAAANRLSRLAWEAREFNKFRLQRLFYRRIREEFGLSAQVVVRLIAKVADAYKLDQKRQRVFRARGSIAFDRRILSWNISANLISIWTVAGRLAIPFLCDQRQRGLLASRKGESDLLYRDGLWLLFTAIEISQPPKSEVNDWLGVDLGLVAYRPHQFEITDCDFKPRWHSSRPALRLHRAGRCHALQRASITARIEVNIAIMRTFVQLPSLMDSNRELARKIEAMEKKYDELFAEVFDAIKQLIVEDEEYRAPRRQIGFHP